MNHTEYNRAKYLRLLDEAEGRIAEARAAGDAQRQARDELLETEREFMNRVTLKGEPLGLEQLLALDNDDLKQLGLRRDLLLDAVELRRRVGVFNRRALAARAAAAESGRLVDALKKYVSEGVSQ